MHEDRSPSWSAKSPSIELPHFAQQSAGGAWAAPHTPDLPDALSQSNVVDITGRGLPKHGEQIFFEASSELGVAILAADTIDEPSLEEAAKCLVGGGSLLRSLRACEFL